MTAKKFDNSIEETFPTTCYVYKGAIYVPHYNGTDAYVGPGYGKEHTNSYTADFLLSVGAVATTEMLWKRGKPAVVQS